MIDFQPLKATAISVTTLILALNISFPNLSDHAGQPLSTYQTRLPTIQYRNPIPKFIYLSYLNPSTGDYLKGNDDIFYVAFWVLVWSSLREILIRMVWKPVGRFCGIDDRHKLQRFAEQGWNLAYYTTFWCMGIVRYSLFLDWFPSFYLKLISSFFDMPVKKHKRHCNTPILLTCFFWLPLCVPITENSLNVP